jgi:hypothetical protein
MYVAIKPAIEVTKIINCKVNYGKKTVQRYHTEQYVLSNVITSNLV